MSEAQRSDDLLGDNISEEAEAQLAQALNTPLRQGVSSDDVLVHPNILDKEERDIIRVEEEEEEEEEKELEASLVDKQPSPSEAVVSPPVKRIEGFDRQQALNTATNLATRNVGHARDGTPADFTPDFDQPKEIKSLIGNRTGVCIIDKAKGK